MFDFKTVSSEKHAQHSAALNLLDMEMAYVILIGTPSDSGPYIIASVIYHRAGLHTDRHHCLTWGEI